MTWQNCNSLLIKHRNTTWHAVFWHKYLIWLLLARRNGFLSIIGLSPLFSADDFSGRRFSPSGVFIPSSFLCRSCAQGIIFDPETASNNLPNYSLSLWHRLASRIYNTTSPCLPKIRHEQDNFHCLLAFICYPWDD